MSVSQGGELKQPDQHESDAYVRGSGGNRCHLNSKSIGAGGGRGGKKDKMILHSGVSLWSDGWKDCSVWG